MRIKLALAYCPSAAKSLCNGRHSCVMCSLYLAVFVCWVPQTMLDPSHQSTNRPFLLKSDKIFMHPCFTVLVFFPLPQDSLTAPTYQMQGSPNFTNSCRDLLRKAFGTLNSASLQFTELSKPGLPRQKCNSERTEQTKFAKLSSGLLNFPN